MRRLLIFTVIFVSMLLLFSTLSAQEDCSTCHSDETLESESGKLMFVDETKFAGSMHGEAGFSCVDCHQDLAGVDDYPHDTGLNKVSCAECHSDVVEIYEKSLHGNAKQKGSELAPDCKSCHSYHYTLSSSDNNSMTSRKNVSEKCGECHDKEIPIHGTDIKIGGIYRIYSNGIHNSENKKGNLDAATCIDCHEHHDLKKISDPTSKVYRYNIPNTCAKCHTDVLEKYNNGIHGQAFSIGISDAPNCTDCHGEHEIIKPDDPTSPVASINVSHIVCAKCHNDPEIIEEYGLKRERISSFEDTYHGLAIKRGSRVTATCVSCHGYHSILPTENPNSAVNENNIVGTCAKCHENSNETFALSYTHESSIVSENKINFYVKNIYIFLIAATIGGMLFHNFIIWLKYFRDKLKKLKKEKLVRRFDKTLVFIHILNLVAFGILVVTGFALRYPDTFWVSILNSIGLTEAARALTHRIAAVLMIYASLHFVIYTLLTKSGRKNLFYLLFKLRDIKEVIGTLKYYIGLSRMKPVVEKYDYTQKAEFWALVWGTIVMVFTGFVLWFPAFFSQFFPSWGIKVAETIHFYEAWLATLSIVVFHFFFVIFHPAEYPMDVTWLSGKISEEECRKKYPEWYENDFK